MGKFVIRRTQAGFQFNLYAANGELIGISEVYSSRAACVKGMQGVIKCARTAAPADLSAEGTPPANPRFEMFRDRAGRYRFRLRARNGKVILSSQGYSSRRACENGVESVRKNTPDSTVQEM